MIGNLKSTLSFQLVLPFVPVSKTAADHQIPFFCHKTSMLVLIEVKQ